MSTTNPESTNPDSFFLRVPIQQEIEFNLFSNCESKQRYSEIIDAGLVVDILSIAI